MCRISSLLYLVWSLKGSLSRSRCYQRRVLPSSWLWFQNRCSLVSGITWRTLILLEGPAALLKQVPNGYKIKFGQFIITTWIRTLVDPLPFILHAVSFYLSNWCYWWRGTDLVPLAPLTSLPPPPPQGSATVISLAIRPHVSSSMLADYVYAPLHTELCLTPGGDEPLTPPTLRTVSPLAHQNKSEVIFRVKI